MEVVIREAAADDYAVLCELFDEVDALHRDNLPQIFQKPTGPVWEQETYRGLITDENVGLFVDCIGVKSDFRGGGVGRMLMHKIQEWAIVKGAIAIELNVHGFNRDAISFYRKLGYDTVSQKMSKLLDRARAAGQQADFVEHESQL